MTAVRAFTPGDMNEVRVESSISSGSPERVRKVELLWDKVYVRELEWLAPGSARHSDAYHPYSTYVLLELVGAKGDQEPVGTARLVADSPVGLPIERFFPFGPLKEGQKFIEIQRLIVPADFRSRRFAGAPFGLMARLMRDAMSYAIGVAHASHVVADVFVDPQVSPIGPLEQIGFSKVGGVFQDTELRAQIPSCAMVINRDRFLRQMLSATPRRLLRYLGGIHELPERSANAAERSLPSAERGAITMPGGWS